MRYSTSSSSFSNRCRFSRQRAVIDPAQVGTVRNRLEAAGTVRYGANSLTHSALLWHVLPYCTVRCCTLYSEPYSLNKPSTIYNPERKRPLRFHPQYKSRPPNETIAPCTALYCIVRCLFPIVFVTPTDHASIKHHPEPKHTQYSTIPISSPYIG